MRSLPPTAVPITFSDVLAGLKGPAHGDGHLDAFRDDIRRYFGVRHCFLASSGRAALTMLLVAMRNLRDGMKDEVILPAYTSFSVPSAVVKAGLKVALCDIDPETMSLDTESLKESLSGRTLCIVVCHLYGYPCDMDAILQVARDAGVFVIDDAAQAMGAAYKGRPAGTLGDAGLFSLSRGKNITAVDGGVIVTDSDDVAGAMSKVRLGSAGSQDRLYAIVKAMTMSLLVRPDLYWVPSRLPFLKLGLSIFSTDFPLRKLTEAQAAIGRRMLKRLSNINEGRKKRARELMASLNGGSGMRFPREVDGAEPVFLRLPVMCNGSGKRGKNSLGIVRSYPTPLDEIEALKPHLAHHRVFPAAKRFSEQLWTLPTHEFVEQQDVEDIVRHFQ